jgi:EAL domain-containing protein (putative c-di-GMP-specific phosphodiesterase class I)
MDQEVAEQSDLADRLVAALRKDEFVLFRQAIVPLAPTGAERLFQEILIRFQEEETMLLPPGSFLPLLEECALMPFLDRWVVSRVAKWVHARRCIKPDWEVPRNSINLSSQTLHDLSFSGFTRKHIQAAGLPEQTLCFEILWEDAVEHAESLLRLAAQLKPAGCCFTIARFEGVRGSFDLLKTLGPDFVKISPRIVRNIDQVPSSAATAEVIHRKCRSLGISTIAEHVESAQVLVQLRRMGVDYAQGFGIQTPQPLLQMIEE